MKKHIKFHLISYLAFVLTACASTQPESQKTPEQQAPVSSKSNNIEGEKYFSWKGRCEIAPDTTEVCYLQQKSSKEKSTMTAVLGYGKGKQFPTLIIEIPKNINIDIEEGMQLKVDKNKPVGFKGKCDNKACRAGFTLDKNLDQQFRTGWKFAVAYKTKENKAVLNSFFLAGIEKGLQAIKTKNKKQKTKNKKQKTID